jgi:hypothetical protein
MMSSLCETVRKEGQRLQSALPDTRGRNEAAGGTALSKAAVQAMLAQAQAELELRLEQKHVRQCVQHPTLTRTCGAHPLQVDSVVCTVMRCARAGGAVEGNQGDTVRGVGRAQGLPADAAERGGNDSSRDPHRPGKRIKPAAWSVRPR